MAQHEGEWTVRRILEWTNPFLARKGVDSPRLSAEMLLANVLGIQRIQLYTAYDRPLDDAVLTVYRELVRRAALHEPVAYLTGHAPFFNLDFLVTRDVLIPRPDTETLVETALSILRRPDAPAEPRVLDLCTGSGCVAAAIAAHHKSAAVIAVDSEPAAADVAGKNIARLNLTGRVAVLVGDLFAPIDQSADKSPFDMIVANPPYIPSDRIGGLDKSVRDYEPRQALDGGPDGLSIHRRILDRAAHHLKPAGALLLEIAFDQGAAALELAAGRSDLANARLVKDHAGHDRVLALTRV